MTRYIENLNECTDPVSGDYLWVVDASAGSTDKDRKVNVGKFAQYSAGTWTPLINGSTTAGGPTYAIQNGYYYVIGDLVWATFVAELTAKDGSAAGDVVINGLPFSAVNLSYNWAANGLLARKLLSNTYSYLIGLVVANSSRIALFQGGYNVDEAAVPVANLANNTLVSGTVIYRKA